MVLQFDDATREAVICAAWGAGTDWFRNLQAGPAIKVQHGRDSYVPEHPLLSDDEAFEIAVGFRRDHPHRLRLLSAVLGWGNLADDDAVRRFVHGHPFVAFRPAVAVAYTFDEKVDLSGGPGRGASGYWDAILGRVCGRSDRLPSRYSDERRTVRVIDVVTHLDVDRPAGDVFRSSVISSSHRAGNAVCTRFDGRPTVRSASAPSTCSCAASPGGESSHATVSSSSSLAATSPSRSQRAR